jgi:hypothetical protein
MNADQAWIAMFRRIPANLHDTLALGLTTGVEIVIQKIVRLDPDFMIIRGRLAGTQDAGRVVLIPYSQLTFVAVIRDLKEAEVEAFFGKSAPPVTPRAQAELGHEESAASEEPEETPAAPLEDATQCVPAPAVNPPKKPEAVSKTVLLAKLRERLKDAGK